MRRKILAKLNPGLNPEFYSCNLTRIASIWACEHEPDSLWACERELFVNFKTGEVPMTVDLEGFNFRVFRVF